jgi:glycogen(starch) synthase
MRILLHTRFYPNLGGIETVALLLAHEWYRTGVDVTVVSDVHAAPENNRNFPFPVYYRPTPLRWLRLMHWTDVFVHMNISLKALWPWLIVRRPFVSVNHAHYYSDRMGYRNWRECLKLRVMSWATNIAVSEAVAKKLPEQCFIIPNPFDASLFRIDNDVRRSTDLVFVGRLVSDKGCDLLIRALSQLAKRGLRPRLTIIGDGPERLTLEQLITSLNLRDQIAFAGVQPPKNVAKLLCEHNIMVVPSLWEEPFGVVALEGAACGCVVHGSDGGGLPEAIGPCGITFRRGDVADLTSKLSQLLQHPEVWDRYRTAASSHLELHHPARVARRYLEVFEHALNGSAIGNAQTTAKEA